MIIKIERSSKDNWYYSYIGKYLDVEDVGTKWKYNDGKGWEALLSKEDCSIAEGHVVQRLRPVTSIKMIEGEIGKVHNLSRVGIREVKEWLLLNKDIEDGDAKVIAFFYWLNGR